MGNLAVNLGDTLPTREKLVTDRLREAILRGTLEPGQRLDQSELANALGVSRSPIRQALRILAAEGLVKINPHRGAHVAELSSNELEETYFIRGMLEGMAARLGARNMDDARIAELADIVERLEQTSDLDKFLELNGRFHHTIYEAAERPRMLSIIQNLRNIAAPYNRQYVATAEHMETAQRWHRRILEACRNCDGEAAEDATRKHLNAVCEGVLGYVYAESA